MTVEDTEYHARRAFDEWRRAERTDDPAAALAHLTLAELHGARADIVRRRMPRLH